MLSTERHSIRCCDDNGRLLSNNPDVHCFPITIPDDDPVFSKFNRECMNFVRSTTDQETGCNAGNKPAEQVQYYIGYKTEGRRMRKAYDDLLA